MRFEELTGGLPGRRLNPERDPEVRRVEVDSRQVEPGDLFVALVWPTADAHPFVPDALERGAVGLVLQADGALPDGLLADPPPVPILVVEHGHTALATIANRFNGDPSASMTVVAVTGTNGKTTTVALLERVFWAADRPCGVIGTLFFRIGGWEIHGRHTTPQAHQLFSLLRAYLDRGAQAVAMEASSHGLALHRMDGVLVDAAIFTNLSHDHLDFHRDLDDYFAAKRRLFDDFLPAARAAGKPGIAIINWDDPRGRQLFEELVASGVPAVSYGLQPGADVTAADLALSPLGSRFTLVGAGGDRVEVDLGLVGHHNLSNGLAAAAAAEALGIDLSTIAVGLGETRSVRGRLERVPRAEGSGPVVLVDYAHTPDALAHTLDTLRELAAGRLHVVFGCGGDRDPSKRPVMGRVAAERADWVVVTSDNPRGEDPESIVDAVEAGARQAVEAGAPAAIRREVDRRRAIFSAVAAAESADLVLIAGKGHETTQEIAGQRLPFDDLAVGGEALDAWRSAGEGEG